MSTLRRSGIRHALSLIAAFMLLIGSVSQTFAQATPDASPAASGDAGPAIGDTVVLFDSSGDELVHIAVTTVTDPDEDIDRADRGFHWVSVEVVIENVSESPYQLNSYGIQLVDAQGFASTLSSASRSNDDYTARPDLSGNEIAPGETVSGWLFFQVINGAEASWIVLNDSFGSQQFAVLANLLGTTIEDGAAVPFFDASAEEIGTVSVDEIILGFEDVDSSVAPNRGMTTVGINVTIENSGTTELEPNSYSFYLIDDLGYLYYPQFYFRDEAGMAAYPDLTSDVLAPGDSATGLITFEISSDASINYIVYQPDFSQLYILAQPGEGSVVSGDTLEPVVVDTTGDDTGDDTSDDTGDDTGDDGAVGEETGDCVGVGAWVDETAANFGVLNELDFVDAESLADVDPDDLRDGADTLREAADAQADVETPEIAQDIQDTMLEFLNGYADVFEEAADRLDNGDDPAEIEADLADDPVLSTVIGTLFDQTTTLTTACPNSGVEQIFG